MKIDGGALLDVNVLVALFDPKHLFDGRAHGWLAARGKSEWGCTPQALHGCLRVMCRLAARDGKAPVSDIAKLLRGLLDLPGFAIFPDAPMNLLDSQEFDLTKLTGHNQLADALLVSSARWNQARLVTCDRSIPWKSVKGAQASAVWILKP